MVRVGRDTKLSDTDEVRASPSTVPRSSGSVVKDELMVCGIKGSPASLSVPIDPYAITRERRGNLKDARPFTAMKELLGASESRPLDDVPGMSVARYGLSKASDVTSL